ncbi:hypothetical protein JTE90_027365 [Oedothorax gibbosus]|uniref:Uncharacterized protein n=1 Tax=Oedothorax gibbosus TaxID=931172 RepID=A0AAV6W450_9ARAC|nr:hypothetical protein JTE90_027365 [Oedothorax gibbosus]
MIHCGWFLGCRVFGCDDPERKLSGESCFASYAQNVQRPTPRYLRKQREINTSISHLCATRHNNFYSKYPNTMPFFPAFMDEAFSSSSLRDSKSDDDNNNKIARGFVHRVDSHVLAFFFYAAPYLLAKI